MLIEEGAMDAIFDESKRIDGEDLRALQARDNWHAAIRLGSQLALLVAAGVAVVISRSAAERVVATLLFGVLTGTLFAPMHEALHQTAFRSRTLNTLTLWLCSLFHSSPPAAFRAFHFEHHRSTQNPERDPEISLAPAALMSWPTSWPEYLVASSGLPLLLARFGGSLWFAVFATEARVARYAPWASADRSRIQWQARLFVLIYATWIALGVIFFRPALYMLSSLVVGHLVLGLYLPAEHTGLPSEGSMFERTRTIKSNALVRWLFWNMLFHTEHHTYPAVPFHRLPALHRALSPALLHVERSYAGLHWRAIKGLKLLPSPRD